jgi:hypothetical protein
VEESGVMESGFLFGAGLTSVFEPLRRLSLAIERRQRHFGFMAYAVGIKKAAES